MADEKEIIERLDRIEKHLIEMRNSRNVAVLPWISLGIALLALALNPNVGTDQRDTMAIASFIVLLLAFAYLAFELGSHIRQIRDSAKDEKERK